MKMVGYDLVQKLYDFVLIVLLIPIVVTISIAFLTEKIAKRNERKNDEKRISI